MDPTDESEDLIDCRNAIENIGLVDDKSCAFVKCKPMTNKIDINDSVVIQNGGHFVDSSEVEHQKCISNGNIFKNEELVKHMNECSQNSYSNDNNETKIVKNSVNCVYNESENVEMSEEIGVIEVVSEEQVIYENNVEESDPQIIRTNSSDKLNHNSLCDEDICDSEVIKTLNEGKTDIRTNTENTDNVCKRFESSDDFDAENSSFSESSSQQSLQSSASQPTPNTSNSASAINNTSAANAVNSNTSANTSQNSQLNECTNYSPISGLNKKKFGKFRILNDESNKTTEDINESSIPLSEDMCVDSKFEDKGNDSGSALHDSQDNSEHSDSTNTNNTQSESKQNKRRGRPAGSTKKDRNSIQTQQTLLEDEDLSIRRSSRLKTLEARKEQEKAVFAKNRDLDETSCDSSLLNTSDANDSQHSVNESTNNNIIKQKKKKSKKDKNKTKDKNKDKDNDSKKRKRKKKLTKNDENKQNCFSEQKLEKCKTSDTHKNECFATPLPPSHYHNIKSNSLNQFNKSTTDSDETSPKPEKVKSRWRRNSELESGHGFGSDFQKHSAQIVPIVFPKETEPIPPFDMIDENIYLFERRKSKSKKETRRMVCDCILTKEERVRGLIGCGEDCLNRMLMIECGSRCSLGDHCANKRFQKKQYARVEPFKTSKKGWGLRALEPLQPNTFIMEYIGEVIDPLDFHNRTQKYSKEKREHHYFMALKSDEIIDATVKGNITRFVNHSCDPNSETQKWTVNGELRIGFFTQRSVQPGEEITFDYQFQRYGKEAQKCFCDSINCRGYIGGTESASILTDGSKITSKNKLEIDEKDEEEILEDLALEEEIAKLSESGGLRNRQQVLMLARLMVRAEDIPSRIKLINIIKGTIEIAYLRLLLDYHGLQLVWSWMVEVEDNELKAQILELLEILPIPNKTMLTDSKVYSVVERWSQQIEEELIKPNTTLEKTLTPDIIESISTPEVKQIESVVQSDSQSDNQTEDDIKPIEVENTEQKMESSDEICSTTETEESNQTKDVLKTENEVEVENEIKEENKESVETCNKSSPRIELRSSSLSLVIKPRSLPNSVKPETPPTPPVVKSKPSIASMAQKLLINWKELKEVFRIPRLERQKRHEDEKEADRKTKEVEERRARGLPVAYDKRGVDDRDYTIAGILGIKRKGIKRTNDSKDTPIKKSSNPSSQVISSNWNKVSKEEHRKMFEMEVAQKDYHEALKRYHQELAYYNAVYGQQIQAHQQQQQQQLYSQDSTVRDQYSYTSYEQYYQNSQTYSQSSINYSVPTQQNVDYMNAQQMDGYIEENHTIDDTIIFSTETTPALIPLVNFDCEQTSKSESSLAIDNVPNNCVIYSDSIPSQENDNSIFDRVYPPPGVFYETSDGNKYFTPLPIDKNKTSINLVFNEKIAIPFETNWTKTLTSNELPLNWKYSYDKNKNIYYYNKIKRKCQWFPPEEEKPLSPLIVVPVVNNDHKLSDNEDSTSVPDVVPLTTSPKPVEEPTFDDLINSGIESIAADSLNLNTESENPINSTESPPIQTEQILESILALEADPRKRRQILNSVIPSTTTAAADTSSSSNRRKFCSTRQVQEQFRNKMSEYVVHCLNPYRKPECKKGRILNNNDFKFLARKITHTVMGKEIKQCKSLENLCCSDAVKHKTRDYVKRYMARFGAFYKPDNSDKTVSPKDIVANDSND